MASENNMRFQVLVRLKQGVLDVQGKAVENGLKNVGVTEVSDIRVGRLVELDVEAGDKAEGLTKVAEVCDKLLANPIIEDYEIRACE